jgi:DNA (cytosine-5)-methyltransferase 1
MTENGRVWRLLDLFCGGGGIAAGYHRGGFGEIVGVDLVRQPGYPFPFVLADALTFPLEGFDAVHASPPCKRFTSAANRGRDALHLFDPHPDCLAPTLRRFAALTVPWVVENVPGAPMPAGSVRLCGSAFGLEVRRHRLFASNVALTGVPCRHGEQSGRFQSLDWERRRRGLPASVVGVYGNLQGGSDSWELRQEAMGIDWLEGPALNQAIPPAYGEHLGRQLVEVLEHGGSIDVC